MSAPTCLVFYGVRIKVRDDEIEQLETRSHQLLALARTNKLETYWGNFGRDEQKYFLLIGKRIGIVGTEEQMELQLSVPDLLELSELVNSRLKTASLKDVPQLFSMWQPDPN